MARLSRLELAGKAARREVLAGGEALQFAAGPGYRSFKSAHALIAALRQSIHVKFQAQMHEAELAEPGEAPRSAIEPVPYEW